MRKTSLKTKIVGLMSALLAVVCVGLGTLAYYNISDSLVGNTKEMLPKLAIEAAGIIEARVSNQLNCLEALAGNEKIAAFGNTQEANPAVQDLLNREIKRLGHKRMAVVDTQGNAIYQDGQKVSLKDRDYFQKAIKGDRAVSDPIVSKVDDSIVMVYAVPIRSGDTIAGVLIATRDGYELSDIAKDISVGKTGNAFVVNGEGRTIAHSAKDQLNNLIQEEKDGQEETDAVSSATTSQEEKQSGLGYENYDTVQKEMGAGKTGFGQYTYNGTQMYLGFAPIGDLGWSIAVQAEKAELLSGLAALRRDTVLASLCFLVLSVLVVYFFAGRIAKRLKKLEYYTSLLGKFDLTFEISKDMLEGKDELGDLSNSFTGFTREVRRLIRSVKASIRETADAVGYISEISAATGKSAEQIALSSNEVALGASQQIEHVDAVMTMIQKNQKDVEKGFEVVGRTLENARNSTRIAETGKSSILGSIEELESVKEAVESANSSIQKLEQHSDKIGNIVAMITSIASQTNLLALNASIEAARAGEAGKGFAVVAEEIRKLAEESSDAAKNIKDLIKDMQSETKTAVGIMEGNLERVHLQVDKIKVGGESLEQIVEVVESTEEEVSTLYNAFRAIQAMSGNMVQAIAEISAIVEKAAGHSQEVASTTQEQSSAAVEMAQRAQELLALSDRLKAEIDLFKVGQEDAVPDGVQERNE
jgi:methyl-accepting chemotaxis protein